MSKFAPIHIISGYSLLKSGLTMKKIESALKANDYFGVGLTDEFTLSGFPPFVHTAETHKLPYVLGLSISVNGDFFGIYALNEEGYQNLIQISLANQKEEFDSEFLKEHASGLMGVIETNHGLFKETFSQINSTEDVDTHFTKYLLEYSKLFEDNFYLGIEVTSKQEVSYANKVRKFANKYTYECVAFPRIKYLKKEDAISVKIAHAIDEGDYLDLEDEVLPGQEYFMLESDYHKIYSEKEIENTNKIVLANQLDFSKPRGTMLVYSSNSDEDLKNMTYSSLVKLGLDDNQQYKDRLEYELNVIKSMGYSDYFLLVQDYVNWAKNHDILVGPGRGSAAGSLVSYLLNITEVDPLKYDLQFERFLNPNRTSMPDIDVDFMDIRRDDVIQYMREKFGNHRVASIVSFQTIGAKQALRDIGRIYEIPDRHISLLCKTIKNDDSTLGQAYKNNPEFKKLCDSDKYFRDIVSFASKIEGLPRQSSIHAAGILLNNVDMEKAMPVSIDLDDHYVSQFEGKYLEEQGFLKMDFLGIRNLTTVYECIRLINEHHGNIIKDFYHIPYDTKEVFDLIRTGQVIGLFQIETPVMKKGIQILKPTCFDDVVALLALNRPGPMAFLSSYAKRRDGKEKITYISNELKEILAPTYGIIVYQEQINMIATKIAGMTPGEGDLFRRAISKKDKKVLESCKDQFIRGCISKGYDEKTALNIFEHIAKFADYGFNKSHSVAYAVLTCRMAWLKAHYPLEFYSAVLEYGSTGESKLSDYISEMRKRNIKVLPPSVNHSSVFFDVHEDSLIFPLISIRGLINQTAVDIVKEREKNGQFTDFFNFVTRMYQYKLNEVQLIALINSGALDELYPSRASMRTTVKSALQYAELSFNDDGQMNLGISTLPTPTMYITEDDPIENLDEEYDVLDIMLSANPLDYKKEQLTKLGVKSINEASHYGVVKVAGIINTIRVLRTKKMEQMAIVKICDQTGDLEVTVFPKIYDAAKGYLTRRAIAVITGRFENKDSLNFIADNIEILGE